MAKIFFAETISDYALMIPSDNQTHDWIPYGDPDSVVHMKLMANNPFSKQPMRVGKHFESLIDMSRLWNHTKDEFERNNDKRILDRKKLYLSSIADLRGDFDETLEEMAEDKKFFDKMVEVYNEELFNPIENKNFANEGLKAFNYELVFLSEDNFHKNGKNIVYIDQNAYNPGFVKGKEGNQEVQHHFNTFSQYINFIYGAYKDGKELYWNREEFLGYEKDDPKRAELEQNLRTFIDESGLFFPFLVKIFGLKQTILRVGKGKKPVDSKGKPEPETVSTSTAT